MLGIERRAWLQRLVLAVPVAWALLGGWQRRWVTEDGFIYLRVVRQLQAGNGPVFNDGERVEAYTGTLWVGVVAVGDLLLPLPIEWVAVVCGLVLTALGVGLAVAGSARLWGGVGADRWLVPVGALLFVAIVPTWIYTTSGLENGLAFAWVGGCTYVLARWAARPDDAMGWKGAAVLGLGFLVRPELVVMSVWFLVAVVVADWRRDTWRRRLGLAAAGMALPAAYQLFRMGYFGSAVPNTAIAKEGGELQVERGVRYLRDFVEPYLLYVPALALLVCGHVPLAREAAAGRDRRRLATMAALVGAAGTNAAYVVAVGGDYHHGRLLLAALLAFVAPVAVVPVRRPRVATIAAATVIALWAVVATAALRPDTADSFADGIIVGDRGGLVMADQIEWLGLNRLVELVSAPEGTAIEQGFGTYEPMPFPLDPGVHVPIAALRGIGVTGFETGTDVHILDTFGLADTFTAHLERADNGGAPFPAPGHEKPLPDPWLVARLAHPDAQLDGNPIVAFGEPLIPRADGDEFLEEVAWARAALRCPDIADLLDAARLDLTAGRFVDNLLGSVGRARLRVPPDPEDAYRRFCGDDIPPEVAALRGDEVEGSSP